MTDLSPVSKEQFEAWVASYPRPLKRSLFEGGDPPRAVYYDLSIGGGLDAIVALYTIDSVYGPEGGWRVALHLHEEKPQ
jgi:hypothetical protein